MFVVMIKNSYKENHYLIPFKKQTGAALLVFMLIIVVGSTFFLTKRLNTNLLRTQGHKQTSIALATAREALIGYAILFPEIDASSGDDPIDGPGYLPCPDTNNNGTAGGSCSLNRKTSIGRFPHKTLKTEDLRDNHDQRLWYVVSDNFRNNPQIDPPLNSETASATNGNLTVNGYNNIAAVIFAAGAPLGNQNRASDADRTDFTNYIEVEFSDSDGDGIDDSITTADTDRYILLSKDELMQAVEKRVLGSVRQALLEYQTENGVFPWLSSFSPSSSEFIGQTDVRQGHIPSDTDSDSDVNTGELPEWFSWFSRNNWNHLIYIAYETSGTFPGAASCTAGTTCLTVNGDDNVRAIALSAGEALTAIEPAQDRTSSLLANYFEGENAVSDNNFVKNRITDTYNDQIKIISTSP